MLLKQLVSAGWDSQRKQFIDDWIGSLKNYHLHPHPLAMEVLSSLGGLVIDKLVFNPLSDTSLTFQELKEINQESGLQLYPIGVNTEMDIMLAFNHNGALYGLLSDMVFRYGKTLAESLDTLFLTPQNIVHLSWEYKEW